MFLHPLEVLRTLTILHLLLSEHENFGQLNSLRLIQTQQEKVIHVLWDIELYLCIFQRDN
jgi:hypothetical protein